MSHKLRNGLFSAVTVAALGFGATQVFASPGAGAAARACSVQRDIYCNGWCQSQGWDAGRCNPLYTGGCQCWFY
ncbi:MAG TPA: hypothetical protein VFT45_05530, partial [Longimicrobium sp.]|nr:hypothetical protein [Longimicrobium sp.]